MQQICCAGRVVTAFNTNIDAVLKISGEKLSKLAADMNISASDLDDSNTQISLPRDVIRGTIKCFINGVAEEWLCEKQTIYEWMRDNLGYDRLQMGGQGGIIANTLSVLGIEQVLAHTNSHPRLQAEQFFNYDNLLALDANGKLHKAREYDCPDDLPLVHWIIEFDKDDIFQLGGKKYVCPKSNRFIATYDPANLQMQINPGFIKYLDQHNFDYLILSGYHNLVAAQNGLEHLRRTIPLIKEWKKKNPQALIHLELASTQDKEIRKAILTEIAPLVDSVGMNEREALDALEVTDYDLYLSFPKSRPNAADLYEVINLLKTKYDMPRVQLHMFGLYITLQNSDFRVSPQANLHGMILAATIAASKAGLGRIEKFNDLLWAKNMDIAEVSLNELKNLANKLEASDLMTSGIWQNDEHTLIAVPTILIDKPLTLVGMGDTISAISLVGAR